MLERKLVASRTLENHLKIYSQAKNSPVVEKWQ